MHTVGTLARYVGVTVRTIKRWQAAGLLPEPTYNNKGWAQWTPAQAQEVLAFRMRRLPRTRR